MSLLMAAGIVWGLFVGWSVKDTVKKCDETKVEQCADCKNKGDK